MVFNFADDSRNLVFRKGSSSIDYEQASYWMTFRSKYSNNYLTNITPTTTNFVYGILYIYLTKVDDNDQYISFSWDKNNYNGFGGVLPSEYNKDDIVGYYDLEIRGAGATIFTYPINNPIIKQLCKVVNDWSATIDTTNKATRIEEDGAEFIYYRG